MCESDVAVPFAVSLTIATIVTSDWSTNAKQSMLPAALSCCLQPPQYLHEQDATNSIISLRTLSVLVTVGRSTVRCPLGPISLLVPD